MVNAAIANNSLSCRFALAALLALLPGYYFLHSGKAPGSGQAEIKERRRGGDPSKEYRDPRDGGVKTLEQKKAKEGK